MKLKLSERQIKEQVRDYLAARGLFSFALLQGLGSHPGLPDRVIHIREAGQTYGQVIYLEIKAPGGKLSEHQKAFKQQCEESGIIYAEVRSVDELIELLGDK